MQVNVIESVGISGVKTELSIQNCIVLKSLIGDLESLKEYLDKRSSGNEHKITMNNTINFLKKVSGEITSLDQASTEMFEPMISQQSID